MSVLRGTCHLASCALSESDTGLFMASDGCSAHATKCHFVRNMVGADIGPDSPAGQRSTLTAVSCTSSGNRTARYYAISGVIELTECVSDEDGTCCVVKEGAMLRATRVAVMRSRESGYTVKSGAHAVLKGCSAKDCGIDGVDCYGAGTKAHVEGCTVQSNGGCGVLAVYLSLIHISEPTRPY